jgi:membrane fusion protein, heavy metal efflux system
MKFTYAAALGAVLGLVFCSMPLQAHEGHDHAELPAPISQSRAARGEAASAAFEAVAVAKGDELAIWLDRFETNAPVDGATIEVETPAGPVTAAGRPGDAYRVEGEWLRKRDQVDLILTVTADGTTEIPAADAGYSGRSRQRGADRATSHDPVGDGKSGYAHPDRRGHHQFHAGNVRCGARPVPARQHNPSPVSRRHDAQCVARIRA